MKLEKSPALGVLLAMVAIAAAGAAQVPVPDRGQAATVPDPAGSQPGATTAPPVAAPRPEQPGEQGSSLPVVASGDPTFGATLTREGLVAEVLARNPEVASAESAWRAALARVPQAAGLDDPMASYSLAPLSIGSSDASLGQELRLSQRLPFPGTRALRREMAAAEAAASEQQLGEVRLRLATMAALLHDDLWLTDRKHEVTEEHVRLLAVFQRVAAARYSAGLAPQQAPLQAEVEAARMQQQLVELAAERRRLVAQLNALLHRPPDAPLPAIATPLDDTVPAPAAEDKSLPARPELRAQEAELEARRAGLALARRAFLPDFEVMTSYSTMWDMREHRWMVGVGLNLPIWRQRRRAAVAEAEAQLAAGEAELAARQDKVLQEVATATASVDETAELLRLYRDRVLPAARDQLAAARASFESGAGDMLGVIEAERGLRAAQVDYYATQAAQASRRAELQRALGRVPGTPPQAQPPQSSPPAAVPAEVTP